MTAPKPPTPQGIDRRLRAAGHPRHDGRTRMTKYSPGYTVDWERGGEWSPQQGRVVVGWDGGADDDPDRVHAALTPLAATLEASHAVERGERVAVVDGTEFRWRCLIVSAPPSPAQPEGEG